MSPTRHLSGGVPSPTAPSTHSTGPIASAKSSSEACEASASHQPKRRRTGRMREQRRKAVEEEEDGFIDLPRSKFSQQLIDGNSRTCAQDGLLNGAAALGVEVTKRQVYDDTFPKKGDTKTSVIIRYARAF